MRRRIYLTRTISDATLRRVEMLIRFEGSAALWQEIWNDEVFLELGSEDDVTLVERRFGDLIECVSSLDGD